MDNLPTLHTDLVKTTTTSIRSFRRFRTLGVETDVEGAAIIFCCGPSGMAVTWDEEMAFL